MPPGCISFGGSIRRLAHTARADSPRNSAAPSVPQARVRRPARAGANHHDVTWVWLFWVTGVVGGLRVGEASVPMVLMCEVRIAEGKPQVEGYAVGERAASADLAGPLGGMLAALVREVAGPGAAGWPLEELERRVVAGVRKLGCAVLQHAVDARAAAEVRLAQVTGADGVPRTRAGRGARTIVTVLGPVRGRRGGY